MGESPEINAAHEAPMPKRQAMDDRLRAKLDEARKRMNDHQAGINANRKDDDLAIRQWARGKQRPANVERDQFRASLTNEDLEQIEERLEQLVRENLGLSSSSVGTVDPKTQLPSVSVEVLEEYHFLRDMVS
jgi:hypothetical protein